MKKHLSFALAVFILALTNIIAFAKVARSEGVGDMGDVWEYDVDGGNCISNYYHPSKLHGSTAKSKKKTSLVHKICAGKWSKASVPSSITGGNKAYWHRCGIDRVCD